MLYLYIKMPIIMWYVDYNWDIILFTFRVVFWTAITYFVFIRLDWFTSYYLCSYQLDQINLIQSTWSYQMYLINVFSSWVPHICWNPFRLEIGPFVSYNLKLYSKNFASAYKHLLILSSNKWSLAVMII